MLPGVEWELSDLIAVEKLRGGMPVGFTGTTADGGEGFQPQGRSDDEQGAHCNRPLRLHCRNGDDRDRV